MAYDSGIVEWVTEALEPMGSVTMRKMMGVGTLYFEGSIFAVVEDELWLKADAESAAFWDEAGCDRYTFTDKDGTVQTMNYRRAPADVYDDADAMREWAGHAIAASRRSAAKRKPKKKA